MAIIKHTKKSDTQHAYLNIFPDQFKTVKEKEDPTYVKNTMDYFSNKAYAEYIKNKNTFVKNYNTMKGILTLEDFYQEDDTVKSFTEMLTPVADLPSYVQQYSILSTPVNELIGEITKRPDSFMVKAFDDNSKSEELEFKTGLLQEYVIQEAKQKILMKAAEQGQEIPEEELQKMTLEEVQEQLNDYTSIAEKWSNHVLTAHKAGFNLKEKSEDAFRDLVITAREFYHIYEDNSKIGFNVQVANPKNVWNLTTPDKKYVSDPSGRNQGAYASGLVEVMELTEIIESSPDLTLEEINHLRTSQQDYSLISTRESNLGNSSVKPGTDSIVYDTYDPLVVQSRMLIEGEMEENADSLSDFFGAADNTSAAGNKFVVVTAYWASKRKVGRLTFLDQMENEQTMLVDELYISGTIPTEISLEWGWLNQWYQGKKTGNDIYHVKPFNLLTYNPIIGIVHEAKNTKAKSVVDMMKPFQVIYNVCMNQLFKLLEKEVGKVQLMSIRHIPIPKDGDAQDALDIWEQEARDRGVVFVDDSPENLKSPSSFNQFTSLDLTRTQEIQSRYTLAQQMKMECWELVGMSKERMGNVAASQTATGTNTAMQQSYTQTEPLFVAHEYVTGQLYQAIVDASVYIESNNDESTISYITSKGDSAFIKVNGTDISMRDLHVYLTNRPEDVKMFNEIRLLSQSIIQNGGSVYDVVELYSHKSQRQLKKVFKDLKDKQEAQIATQNQQKQQELDQAKGQFEQTLQDAERVRLEVQANENYESQLDRINKKEVATINALKNNENAIEDKDGDGIADALQLTSLTDSRNKATNDYNAKMSDIQSKDSLQRAKLAVDREKLQVDRENQANDLAIAKENSKGRTNKN